jgi:hypothetical protein
MNSKGIALAILAVSALTMVGCPQENSCNILTNGIFCAFRVVEEDGQALATATFTVGNAWGTELALGPTCGDSVTVNGVAMREQRNAFVYYSADLDVAETYTFEFKRGDEVFTSTTATPPAENASISRAQAFNVTWEDNNDGVGEIDLMIGGNCVYLFGDRVTDNGLYTVNAGELERNTAEAIDDACTADVVLAREVEGQLDPGLKGLIVGRTVDRTWFTTVP